MPFPEFAENTEAHSRLEADEKGVVSDLGWLKDDTLREIMDAWLLELSHAREDLWQTRQRAGSLLTAAGFLSVIATLVPSSHSGLTLGPLAWLNLALLAYFFIGTVWLTIAAIRVGEWDSLGVRPPEFGRNASRKLRQERAHQIYIAGRNYRIRLNGPTGYLRDAFTYFAATIVLLFLLVLVRAADPDSFIHFSPVFGVLFAVLLLSGLAIWITRRRTWVIAFGTTALAAVIITGLLGVVPTIKTTTPTSAGAVSPASCACASPSPTTHQTPRPAPASSGTPQVRTTP